VSDGLEQEGANPSAWPLWRWILLAVAPGLLADLLATVAATFDSGLSGELGGLLMFLLLGMPLIMIPYLILLSKWYAEERGPQRTSRATFVIGFCVVNLFLWGGSCAIVLSNMSFH
jgi:hypothetical protein